MRVLVVDDSAFMRRAVKTMIDSEPGLEVVATGRNGKEGLELAAKLQPDVITLDIEMPEMDGLTALRRIMRECPTNIIMVSSLTTEGSFASLQALRLGAADVIAKDHSQVSLTVTNMRDELVQKVKAIGVRKHGRDANAKPAAKVSSQVPDLSGKRFDFIVIGSSTGGPPVLETIFSALPQGMTTPIVVAQHMPELFTRSMTERLDDVCSMQVKHLADQMPLERGCVYIAPGGRHTHLCKTKLAQWHFEVNDEPQTAVYKPSVDALFSSAADVSGGRVLAIMLTGIGQDGCEGSRRLTEKGATLFAQTAETCVVYGMPKAVTEAGYAEASLSPEEIAQALATLARPAAAA